MESKWKNRCCSIVCSPDTYVGVIVLIVSIVVLKLASARQVEAFWDDVIKTNMMITIGMFGWLLTALAVLYAVQSKTVREYLGKKRNDLLEYIVWMFKFEGIMMLGSIGYNYFIWLTPRLTKGKIIFLCISIGWEAYILVGVFLIMRFLLNSWKADIKTSGNE